ncbi:MAG: PKD domain-containing protein, partial [Thermoplasmata archaeon]|nr:PKD domain-containing protein [Thermoplasmata archaeon]
AEGSYIPPSETIEVLATVMNVGLNEEFITVKGKAIRQSGTPVTHHFKEEETDLLDPGDKEQVAFSWTLPIGTYNYKIEIWVEIDKDGNPDNNLLFRYIRAQKLYDISVLSLYADPMVQDVARARAVTAEVKNIGNIDLENIVQLEFEAYLLGSKVDEYTTTISLQRNDSCLVTWDWQSFKYGLYAIEVEGTILEGVEDNTDDNTATISGIITVETIFSDTREEGESPYYLDHTTGEFKLWNPIEMGDFFWTGDNESDPNKAGWHVDTTGHFSRRSWYGGIPSKGIYANNMEACLTSQALNLEDFTNVHLSFYTKYILEGNEYDYVDISISNDADDNDSWQRLVKFPAGEESYNSSMEPGNQYGWLHKDIRIPDAYLQETFYMRILLKTNNDITYQGVWIDDLTLYGTTTANHAPVARFTGTYENASYSRNVIRNPTIDLLHIKGNYTFNNLPKPIGDKQRGIQLGVEIRFNADFTFDPDVGDDDIAYNWNFGDGQTGYGKVVTHSYTEELPLEGYFIVTLKTTDDHGAFTEDTMVVWIGNKAPIADFIVTPYFNTSLAINDTNDMVENGVIDVFYGDRIVFQQKAIDPENDPLTYDWLFHCDTSKYETTAMGDNVSGMVGEDFLYEGLDGSIPIKPVSPVDYTVTIFVTDGISISEKSYTIRVHPYAQATFTKQVRLDATILDASVSLVWRGFPEEAAPQASYISPERPVFVYIDETPSPVPNLAYKGGIGLVYDIRVVGCRLQNREEGFIEAEISLPILTSDLKEIGDPFSLQEDLRLEYYDEVEKRFIVVEGSHVLAEGGVKYVVGTVDNFSIFTAIVDSVYNSSNPRYHSVLPDLSVYRIKLSRDPALNGQDVEVRVYVKNTGRIHARNVDVNFYDGEYLIGDQRIDLLKCGGGVVVVKEKFTAAMIDPDQIYENHYIKVFVNKGHTIDEGPQNYKNNEELVLLMFVTTVNHPPAPLIIKPKDGKTVEGKVTIKGRISDDDTNIGKTYMPFGNND